MSSRKNKKADLERKRSSFLVIGLSVACAFTLTAFEWITFEKELGIGDDIPFVDDTEEEMVKAFVVEPKKRKATKNPDKVEVVKEIPDPDPIPKPDPKPDPDPDPPMPEYVDLDSLGDGEPDPIPTTPFIRVEKMPEFPGGEASMFEWLNRHARFPQICQDAGISGKAHVRFVVDEQGNIAHIEAMSREHKAFEKEAKRLVRNMPKWIPGEQRGRKVPVYFSLPVDFNLK